MYMHSSKVNFNILALAVMPAHHKDFCLAMQLTEGTHVYSWFIHSTPTSQQLTFRVLDLAAKSVLRLLINYSSIPFRVAVVTP